MNRQVDWLTMHLLLMILRGSEMILQTGLDFTSMIHTTLTTIFSPIW